MKSTIQVILSSILLLFSIVTFGQIEQQEDNINIVGILISENELVTNETVWLYENDEIIDEVETDDIGVFEFKLDYNKLYCIVIGGEKYDMKWIMLGTNIPEEHREDDHETHMYVNVTPTPREPVFRIVRTLAKF